MRVIGALAQSGDTQAPTQPQNLIATAINRQRIDLSWTASTDNIGVAGYQIFRNASPLNTVTSTSYSDTTVSASTTYTYTVVAFDSAGNNSVASASAQATTPANASPAWQTIPSQVLIVGNSYSLNLNNFCSDADADTIQYSIPSGTLPTGLTLNTATISGTPTTAGQTPTITVRASDGFVTVDATIAFSTKTVDLTAPPVPTGLAATVAGSTQIDLTWNASSDAAGTANEYVSGTQDYRVYRSTDGTNFSLRTTTTSASYSDTGLTAGTQYFYKVTARDVSLNESAQSTSVNATTTASSSATLESDWQTRIAGTGVVWFHDFRADAEVNAFRWSAGIGSGNDPNSVGSLASNVRRITTDGIGNSGCLEIIRGPGANEPSLWWRPFSPMTQPGNGKAANDPGANGTISPRTWAATQGGGQLTNWNQGWYGHATYANADPTHFEGNDFYLQIRVKMDPRRITGGNEANTVGKFVWFSTAEGAQSLSNGEHVIWSYGHGGNQGTRNYVRVYALGVTGIGAFDPLDDEDASTRIQIGSDSAADWYYSGGWDTLLFHLRPGLINATTGANCSLLEIWAAHEGETSYTKIWNQEYGLSTYEARNGLQALILAAYNNGNSFPQQFYHRYTQVIFSKQTIPCPQFYAPTWFANQTTSTWSALDTRISDLSPQPSEACITAWGGAAASPSSLIIAAQGGHSDSAENYAIVLNLVASSPTFAIEVNKSSSAQIDRGYYNDGKPASRHGYAHSCFIPAGITNGNRWFSPIAANTWGNGNVYPDAASYVPGSGAYDPENTFPDFPGGQISPGVCCEWDSVTSKVWVKEDWIFGAGGGVRSFDPATKTYSAAFGSNSRNDAHVNCALDPVRRIFCFIEEGAIFAIDLDDPTHGYYTITTTGVSKPNVAGPGLIYDPVSACFIAWAGGATLLKIVPGANWRVNSWAISNITNASGGVTPTSAVTAGTYGRFRYISALRALVVVNATTQTPYVYKLPAGSV